MRRLLVKLVAIETALVGWLAYWLFLVYANNPGITEQLAGSLARFPQFSFSTIDITILVIISGLAIALAFKFQKGLRPGIRLERALQMLENLMRRNLVLEAQVAELKIEKTHVGHMPPLATPSASSTEPRAGSWEKAFRTPLEAGPPAPARSSSINDPEADFEHERSVPPPRIELRQPVPVATASSTNFSPRPPSIIATRAEDKPFEKPATLSPSTPATPSSWEDSPKFLGGSKGILNPSPPPRKIPAVSESGGLRQPYIPSPAPKTVPSSVIFGPMSSIPSPQARASTKVLAPVQASPKSLLPGSTPKPPETVSKPLATAPGPRLSAKSEPSVSSPTVTNVSKATAPQPTPSSNPSPLKPSTTEKTADEVAKSGSGRSDTEREKADDKSDVRPGRPVKRKFAYEEE